MTPRLKATPRLTMRVIERTNTRETLRASARALATTIEELESHLIEIVIMCIMSMYEICLDISEAKTLILNKHLC